MNAKAKAKRYKIHVKCIKNLACSDSNAKEFTSKHIYSECKAKRYKINVKCTKILLVVTVMPKNLQAYIYTDVHACAHTQTHTHTRTHARICEHTPHKYKYRHTAKLDQKQEYILVYQNLLCSCIQTALKTVYF